MQLRITALLTCHNRRGKTVECLLALRSQMLPGWNPTEVKSRKPSKEFSPFDAPSSTPDLFSVKPRKLHTGNAAPSPPPLSGSTTNHFEIEVFLVDDGCTDGTADAVRNIWPEATILRGDGNLYWCGGMRRAWAAAAKTDPDYYLLLNDDTIIMPEALSELLQIVGMPEDPIIGTGAIADPETGDVLYGGIKYNQLKPTYVTGQPHECDTMNANFTLVTRAVYRKIGVLHPAYTHSMGDWDYGHAARRNNCRIIQSGKIVGYCRPNPATNTWYDSKLPKFKRIRLLNSPKGLPFREWVTYCYRNMGWKWLQYVISPYLRILFK